jgi:transcriptional regulator with XRE-family HTH domain
MNEHGDTKRNPVKEVRQALGLSQKEIAREIGCGEHLVRFWESMGTLPHREKSLNKLRELAKRAGIKIEL